MTNEHNPIAQLITKIQQKWAQEVTPFPELKLIRLLIDEDESQLYEGFLKLESSNQGKLPELFVALLTPFRRSGTYSRDLIKDWFEAFDRDKKIFDQLETSSHRFIWDDKRYRQAALSENIDHDNLLLEILGSFHSALNMPDRMLTIALFHYSISSILGFKDWIKGLMKLSVPKGVQFCIFDLKMQRHYDHLFYSFDPMIAKTIMVDLDLAGAIKKVLQSGDPNNPGTRLQQYIMQMGEAVAEKNITKLNNLGNKCIADMTRSKVKSLMATAHIAYAGMLFSFKKFDDISLLLDKGVYIAEAGKKANDITCKSLLGQFYNFKASNCQLRKENKEAVDWFCKSAETSIELGQILPAISAYKNAGFLAKRHSVAKYPQILEQSFIAGKSLTKEELSVSEYSSFVLEYYNFLYQNSRYEEAEEVDLKMKQVIGDNWKSDFQEKVSEPDRKGVV